MSISDSGLYVSYQVRMAESPECSPKSPLVDLNEDVVAYLCRMMTKRNILSTMCTCHALFAAGLPTLLGREYRFGFEEALRSFYEFLVLASPASFTCLRNLDLHITAPSSSQVELVADIFARAHNLTSIAVNPELLKKSQLLYESFALMGGLRSLRLRGYDTDTAVAVLSHIRAPLLELDLSVGDESSVISILPSLGQSLQKLSLSSTRIAEGPEFIYPKVTWLLREPCSPDGLHLSTIFSSFPHLSAISTHSYSNDFIHAPHTDRNWVAIRDENIAFQTAQSERCQQIDYIAADGPTIYMLSLQHSVSAVILQGDMSLPADSDISWLVSCLTPLRPKHLHLMLVGDIARFPDIFVSGMDRLNNLRIDLDFDEHSALVSDTLRMIYETLGSLRLSRLSLTVSWYQGHPRDLARELDDEALALRAVAVVPTLTRITVHGMRYTHWTVERDSEGKRELKKIQAYIDY